MRMRSADYEEVVAQVYEALVPSGLGRVLRNQQYVGKRSGHSHQIDVSIEMKVAELEILVIVECKYYNRTVEIGEVLELAERIDDIGAHKGALVSRRGFQAGALAVARSRSIALVRTEPQWEVILYASGLGGLANFTRIVQKGDKPPDGALIAEDVLAADDQNLSGSDNTKAWRQIILRLSESG